MVKNILKSFSVVAIFVSSTMAADDFVWSNVSIGGGGFVSAVIASPVDKNLFYTRTDVGGAYRWDESTSKWVPMMDWVDVTELGLLGVEAIAVDPSVSGKVYMVAGTSYWNDGRTAFLRSTDKGSSWTVIYTWDSTGVKGSAIQNFKSHGNGMGRGNGEALAIDPNNANIMFYGSRGKGLWKSTNNGSTWSRVTSWTTAAGSDTTWNGAGFSFVTFAPASSTVLYAGFLREGTKSNGTIENVFTSKDAGATWKALPIPDSLRTVQIPSDSVTLTTTSRARIHLMPQRAVISSDGNILTVTFGDGAGPHTMAWDEGWGMIYDGFGRGAVLQYSLSTGTWTDVSPENFIDDPNECKKRLACWDSLNAETPKNPLYYAFASYGGIAINPGNNQEMIVTTEGYRGPQFWYTATGNVSTSWKDEWGTNIYRTTDGGKTWDASFRYYWMDGGYYPTYEEMSANGIGWMHKSSIHWSGSVVIDPFNTERVWVTSGNGVFRSDNVSDYEVIAAGTYDSITDYYYSSRSVNQHQVWKVASHGIEETVPFEVVSIPGGPLISVIGDYDGFRHDSIAKYPSKRHETNVSGTLTSIGTTRGLAYAPKAGTLVKVADLRLYKGKYNNIKIDPIQISKDSGTTWSVVGDNVIDTSYKQGTVGISTDGAVILWTPATGTTVVQRYANSSWSTVSGINGAFVVGDPENANVFYAYMYADGKMYKSTDKGLTFSLAGTPGISNFRKFRTAPGREGDLWIPLAVTATDGSLSGALMRSTDGGATWNKVAGVGFCEAVGFGKAKTTGDYPAVYIFAKIGDVTGVFGSDDEGATWTRVNDDGHEYGGLANGEFVMGDMNTYGVVYMSTAGRGIAARVPSDWNMGTSSSGATIGIAEHSVKALSGNALANLRGDILNLTISGNEKVSVGLFDLRGRAILQKTVSSSSQMKLDDFVKARGAYLLIVKNGSKIILSRSVQIAQ
ncbi:MAG: hypothetical protein AUK31_08640 [Fibrobacteres bacterium CG2_30_45_31]|nr:MAG: hypothetical protein AUK31_08640 [Fibrobacteres bacterium CG2_30_45_31]